MPFVGTRDDLARIHFKVFPGLSYVPRMLAAVGAVGVGLVIQFQRGTPALVVGGAFVFFGILLTLVDSKTNKPPRVRGKRTWERVTPEEYRRITALVERGKRWARKDLFGASNLVGFGMFALIALALVAGFFYIANTSTDHVARIWAVDGGLFLLLTYVVGARKAWTPGDLLVKIAALQRLLDDHAAQPIPRLTFQPMLEVAKGKRGQQLPRDARLLVTVDKAPDDLIGFQVQCSINRVSNTAFPYVYAVILARKAFGLKDRLANTAVSRKEVLTFEAADDEVDVAVLRQKTSKTTGYHTKPADQRRIFEQAAALALALANQ